MITEHDIKTVEKIKAILEPMTRDGETGVDRLDVIKEKAMLIRIIGKRM